MEFRVSFQGVYGVQGLISRGLWSIGSHSRGCMKYRISFQKVYELQGFIPVGFWSTASYFRGFMEYMVSFQGGLWNTGPLF